MGLSLANNNKIFLVAGILFQLWFIIIYALNYEYQFIASTTAAGSATNDTDFANMFQFVQGMIMCVFLLLLFFLGFTLINTYVAGSAYSSALFSFMIIVFTVQYYFIIRSFWL